MEFQRAGLAAGQLPRASPRAFDGSRQQLPFEWLDEVIIAAGFQDGFAIDLITAARHDDDPRQVELFADRAANLEATHLGQEQIAHDRVRPLREGHLDASFAFKRFEHLPAMLRKETRDFSAALHVVLDE